MKKWFYFSKKLACELQIISAFTQFKHLEKKMIEICEKEDRDKDYDARYIKKLLKNCYGDFILFSEDVGIENLIYFKNMAEYIIRESEREKGCAQELIDETKNRILKATVI